MRVTGGEARGRPLRTARGLAMRPTAGRVREALFSLIGEEVVGALFLDLCAGSGSVGIEALSRGARRAWFVDSHPTAIALIRRNLSSLGLEEEAVILRRDAAAAVGELARRGTVLDLAFLDPPYDTETALRCLRLPGWRAIMPARGRVYVEHRSGLAWPPLPGWRPAGSRRFGDTTLTAFEREADK